MSNFRGVHWAMYLMAAIALSLPAAFVASAQTVRYIHTDGLGSVVLVTNSDRNAVERSEYEPYGNLLNRPITDGPGYVGHVADAATGLDYMQQRYYDPSIGRFLSIDPVTASSVSGSNFNRYWYANSNPYRFTDPDGRLSRGSGWTDRQWKAFDRAQKRAAGNLTKAASKLTKAIAAGGKSLQKAEGAFEKNFGAGTGTLENMTKVASDMGAMADALSNTGEGAIPANAMTGTALAAAYPSVGADTLAGVPKSGSKQVLVNISHASFGNNFILSWAAGHETAHAVLGYEDQKINGISAYKFGSPEQRQVFDSLPGAQRLINPDHLMDEAQ
ncbi:hypothetical protein NB721_000668 [Xanthomonas sacchari]|uniref:Teneurin-like YD-shell domain-containing protein n=3 Tax=Xanthomonas sacchari TaxID=56458 RepID=A0A2P5Z6P6_9XANT|nr:hypothetical protein [Xanthomonas sacchari]PPU83902.1 hypothetical protein XsacCFBP4641_05905 [Xanthomonas sacchari]